MKQVLLLIVFLTLTIISCLAQENTLLSKRVNLFYENFTNGRYKQMWLMTSKQFKVKNEFDKKSYIQELKKFSNAKIKHTIKDLKINGNQANVSVEVCLSEKEEQKWSCETDDNVWILEKSKWMFDNQIPER
jgi:hypothetical protein